MSADFQFLMISAMYENGGNTTQRFLDGHPQMRVYPFESQLGTRLVSDQLSSTFPVKYRWPVFALEATPEQDYQSIIDEEGKVRARTPDVSKFRHVQFDLSDEARCKAYVDLVGATGRSRPNNVAAFFRATFEAWSNFKRTSEQSLYVGYSPIVVVDADKIMSELPQAHVLHVVRNPWSAFAETKRRPVPLTLRSYMLAWTLNQYHALLFKTMFPTRLHIVRFEDLVADSKTTLGKICTELGLDVSDSLNVPSWNGNRLDEVNPWGTIRKATPEANRETAKTLSDRERSEVAACAWQYLEIFDYKSFM
ncbi:MAG TPA: sulfotransferase [Candidatus Dormibacteraeota bacterium]|nr:sulfotransferase [Candidatus Dormibacteraeota bacterium]